MLGVFPSFFVISGILPGFPCFAKRSWAVGQAAMEHGVGRI